MKFQSQFPHETRQSGATEWMLDHLVDSIEKGEPLSVVIGAHHRSAQQLKQRLQQKLEEKNIEYHPCSPFNMLMVEENSIYFIAPDAIDKVRGLGVHGLYVDHFVTDGRFVDNKGLIELHISHGLWADDGSKYTEA